MSGREVCAHLPFPIESQTSLHSSHTAIQPSNFLSPSPVLSTPTSIPPEIVFLSISLRLFRILTSRHNSLAITGATPRTLPADAPMLICPLFTAPETAKDLEAKSYKQKLGRRDPPSWCSPGQKFADFETAGHTLLLDALVAAAGLLPRTAWLSFLFGDSG